MLVVNMSETVTFVAKPDSNPAKSACEEAPTVLSSAIRSQNMEHVQLITDAATVHFFLLTEHHCQFLAIFA